MRRLRFIIFTLCIAIPAFSASSQEAEIRYFHLLGGPPGSTTFSLAAKLANVISNPPGTRDCAKGGPCGVPGLIAITQNRKNSQISLRAVEEHQAESTIAPADQVFQANKNDPGGGNLRALGSLDRLTVHFIVLKSAMINRLDQLKGKKIAIGREGSDNEATAKMVLNALGIDILSKNILNQPVYKSFRDLRSENIDALIVVDRINSTALNSIFSHGDVKLISLDEDAIAKLNGLKGFTKIVQLPGDLYPGEQPFSAIEIPLLWLVHSDVSIELAYALARALQSDAEAFPSFSQESDPLPLHEGAQRLYREMSQNSPDP